MENQEGSRGPAGVQERSRFFASLVVPPGKRPTPRPSGRANVGRIRVYKVVRKGHGGRAKLDATAPAGEQDVGSTVSQPALPEMADPHADLAHPALLDYYTGLMLPRSPVPGLNLTHRLRALTPVTNRSRQKSPDPCGACRLFPQLGTFRQRSGARACSHVERDRQSGA